MLLYEDETQEIISAFYEVYNNLGGGFLENVYQDALSIEFKIRNIPFEKESKMNIYYKNQLLDRYYIKFEPFCSPQVGATAKHGSFRRAGYAVMAE